MKKKLGDGNFLVIKKQNKVKKTKKEIKGWKSFVSKNKINNEIFWYLFF